MAGKEQMEKTKEKKKEKSETEDQSEDIEKDEKLEIKEKAVVKEESSDKEDKKKENKSPKTRKGGRRKDSRRETFDVVAWQPKTEIGRKVKEGEIKDLGEVLDAGKKVLEEEIVDVLINPESDLLLIGQSKGKFGGGQRRVFKQTQKKTREGNKPKFETMAVVGNSNGFVGVGYGKSKETVPAREKAIRNAKLNVFKIARGCGSWQCGCKTSHSIPFTVEGKCGSVIVKLIPAPKGKGLCIESECGKILKLAGIEDVWSRSYGQTGSKTNMIKACVTALKKLIKTKFSPEDIEKLGITEGSIKKEEKAEKEPGEKAEKGKDKAEKTKKTQEKSKAKKKGEDKKE